jgi:hypothetical protein
MGQGGINTNCGVTKLSASWEAVMSQTEEINCFRGKYCPSPSPCHPCRDCRRQWGRHHRPSLARSRNDNDDSGANNGDDDSNNNNNDYAANCRAGLDKAPLDNGQRERIRTMDRYHFLKSFLLGTHTLSTQSYIQ